MVQAGHSSATKDSRIWLGWMILLLVIALLVTGLVVGLPRIAKERGWLVDGGQNAISPEALAELQPDLSDQAAGPLKLTAAPEPRALSAEAIAQAFAQAADQTEGTYGIAIAQWGAEGLLYESGSRVGLIPASTMKVVTALAATQTLGSQAVFTTRTVLDAQGRLVLVGGGDPMLASQPTSHRYSSEVRLPTTAELALTTAEALTAQGLTQVSMGYDDSLFAHDPWHADWAEEDRAWVAPVSALVIDGAGTTSGTTSPSADAAAIFAEQLRQAGIEVTGEPVAASAAGGRELAAINSVPLELIVQQTLVHSDNFIAEMLLRQLAVATGHPVTFAGGAAALTESLTTLGVWQDAMVIVDGSGMSLNNRLTAAGLVAALQVASTEPGLSSVLDGLPVAGVSGTMANRCADQASHAALGQVRAKTGSLTAVSSLAGYTLTQDGGVVVFAVIGNGLPPDRDPRPFIDHVAAALAGCQCLAG